MNILAVLAGLVVLAALDVMTELALVAVVPVSDSLLLYTVANRLVMVCLVRCE